MKLTHTEYMRALRAAQKEAIAAGFTHEPGKGYWKALHAYCDAHKIKTPATRAAKVLPAAAKVAAPVVKAAEESPRDRKNRLERERRARVKAATVGNLVATSKLKF